MAGKSRDENTNLGLPSSLAHDPYKYGFYEALRQLECLYRKQPRLGRSARPVDDKIRLGQTPSQQFAPSTLDSFAADQGFARLKVFFFGLFGPNGPLPLHLTEYARDRVRNAKDSALVDFADMFHHRLLSLFYRAWADKEPTVQMDRPENDRFAFYVGSLLGIGGSSFQNRDALPDHTKLHFAAHLACHTRHAEGLESMLNDFFRLPVKITEFIGEWLDIPKDSYSYLDRNVTTGQLGISSVIGTKIWQCQHKFRITMGPLSLEDYEQLLPTGSKLKNLVALVKNYLGFEFNWDLHLILKKNEVPPTPLGKTEQGKYGQLGWTTWLQNEKIKREPDAADLYLNRERMT